MNPEWLWGILLFARAVLFGAALGMVYDGLRLLRILFFHPAWLIAVEDLLFFLPASLAHIFFHYAFGEGEIRWFAVLGVVSGFILYLLSIGRITQRVLIQLKSFLKKKIIVPLQGHLRRHRERRAALRSERKRGKEKQSRTKSKDTLNPKKRKSERKT